MNIVDYYGNLASEFVMRCEETKDQFIFQTIRNWASNNYQIEIDKDELIAAIQLIRKSRGADIPFMNPAMKIAYMAGYDDGVSVSERKE